MEVCLRLGLGKNFVPRIWSSDPYEEVIFRSDVTYDIAFAFTAILSSYQYINTRGGAARIKPQQRGRTYDYRWLRTSIGCNDDICQRRELLNAPFGRAPLDVVVVGKFFSF